MCISTVRPPSIATCASTGPNPTRRTNSRCAPAERHATRSAPFCSFVNVVFDKSGKLTSTPPTGAFAESVTMPARIPVAATSLRSTISVHAEARANAGTRTLPACPLARSVSALRVSTVSSGTPHNANRPLASAVAETQRESPGVAPALD